MGAADNSITATVERVSACNTLEFGLADFGLVCDDCGDQWGDARTATFSGAFAVGYPISPFMNDRGNPRGSCCTDVDCDAHYDCSSRHAFVEKLGPNDYRVYFTDAGCNCAGNAPAGSDSANLLARITIS